MKAKVQIFVNEDMASLQQQMNEFIAKRASSILFVTQSESIRPQDENSMITITLIYKPR